MSSRSDYEEGFITLKTKIIAVFGKTTGAKRFLKPNSRRYTFLRAVYLSRQTALHTVSLKIIFSVAKFDSRASCRQFEKFVAELRDTSVRDGVYIKGEERRRIEISVNNRVNVFVKRVSKFHLDNLFECGVTTSLLAHSFSLRRVPPMRFSGHTTYTHSLPPNYQIGT